MYAHVPYYMKIKSISKFKIRNIKLSKISFLTVLDNIAVIEILNLDCLRFAILK